MKNIIFCTLVFILIVFSTAQEEPYDPFVFSPEESVEEVPPEYSDFVITPENVEDGEAEGGSITLTPEDLAVLYMMMREAFLQELLREQMLQAALAEGLIM